MVHFPCRIRVWEEGPKYYESGWKNYLTFLNFKKLRREISDLYEYNYQIYAHFRYILYAFLIFLQFSLKFSFKIDCISLKFCKILPNFLQISSFIIFSNFHKISLTFTTNLFKVLIFFNFPQIFF